MFFCSSNKKITELINNIISFIHGKDPRLEKKTHLNILSSNQNFKNTNLNEPKIVRIKFFIIGNKNSKK